MNQTFDVITIGSALRDVMFYTNACTIQQNPSHDPLLERLLCVEYGAKIRSEKVFFEFGGGASNTAVNFVGLGLRTSILTAIGFDFDGRVIKEHLDHQGVDIHHMQVTQHYRTGFSFLIVDEHTGEHSAFVYYGAAQDINISRATLQKKIPRCYYIASLNCPKWRELLQVFFTIDGPMRAWNPGSLQLKAGWRGLRPFLLKTSVLILNKDEASELIQSYDRKIKTQTLRSMVRVIHQWGPSIVVITSGRDGATVFDGTSFYHDKPGKHTPLDTTGAGDCFGSTFVAGLLRTHGNVARSIRLATENANALVSSIGAQRGLLRWKTLVRRVNHRP